MTEPTIEGVTYAYYAITANTLCWVTSVVERSVQITANLGGDKGFYAEAGAGASLQGGVNYNAEAGYKGDKVDAKIDTGGLQIGTGFGGDKNNVNVNLAKRFDGNTNVNVEGKKQLNKYLDLTGSADTSGNYRAGIGFDFKF